MDNNNILNNNSQNGSLNGEPFYNSQYILPPLNLEKSNLKLKEDHAFFKAFKEECRFMLVMTLIYAFVFTFSLYRNFSGIVTPLYPIASVIYVILCAKKVGANLLKDSIFYIAAICLLSLNLCLTKDAVVTFLDHVGIVLLVTSFALHSFYNDEKWGLGKYVSQILTSIFGSIENIAAILEDITWYRKEHAKKDKNPIVSYIIIGVLCAVPLLVIVLILLGSADIYFRNFLDTCVLEPLANLDFSNIDLIIMFVVALIGGYAFIRKLCMHNLSEDIAEISKKPQAIAVTINVVLGSVYVLFSGFQIVNLFLGLGSEAALPANYTYAEYAREGFFQLVVVCLINMILVLLLLHYFENKTALKISLTVISVCTYIMIASSTFRMFMYVEVYQLTYTRVFVFFALIIIFMVMNGIVIYIYNNNFKLFRYCMIMVTVLYIAFAYARPEQIIARNNLSDKFYSMNDSEAIDYSYLMKLSSDATPVMKYVFEKENDEYGISHVLKNAYKNNSFTRKEVTIRNFNFSEYIEYKALSK